MPGSPLTPRLLALLERAAVGLTDKEIASELGIALPTVESHWRRLRERYASSSRTEIVARYLSEAHAADQEALMAELVERRETARRMEGERDEARSVFNHLYFGQGPTTPVEGSRHDLVLRFGQVSNQAARAEALVTAAKAGGVMAFELQIGSPPVFTLASDNVFDVVGHPKEALDDGWFLPKNIDPIQWEAIVYAFPAAIAEMRPDAFCYEYRLQTAEGEFRWILNRAKFTYGDGPFPVSYAGIGMDVTGFWPNRFRLLYLKDGAIHDRTPGQG